MSSVAAVSAATVHGLDIAATGAAEPYTSGIVLARLADEHRLGEDPAGNLVSRTPRTSEARQEDFVLDRAVMPAAVVAADVLESGETRSMRTGRRVLDRLTRCLWTRSCDSVPAWTSTHMSR